jgi:hypothetical protein
VFVKDFFDKYDEELDFKQEIKSLLTKHPQINISTMGFIENWEELILWK